MNTRSWRWVKLALVAIPLAFAAGCTTLSTEDRATLTEARDAARQAQTSSQQALQAANEAKAAAQKAEADAAAANQKVDRAFSRSTRTK